MSHEVVLNGIFITYPVIAVSQDQTTGAPIVDRFIISNVAKYIVAVNGLDQHSEDLTNGGKTTVHFTTESGMRPIISEATPEQIVEMVKIATDFCPIEISVVSMSEDEGTKEKKVKRFTGYVDAGQVVGVNNLSEDTPQFTEDVKSIIYFKPECGLRPTFSTETAQVIMDKVNEHM